LNILKTHKAQVQKSSAVFTKTDHLPAQPSENSPGDSFTFVSDVLYETMDTIYPIDLQT